MEAAMNRISQYPNAITFALLCSLLVAVAGIVSTSQSPALANYEGGCPDDCCSDWVYVNAVRFGSGGKVGAECSHGDEKDAKDCKHNYEDGVAPADSPRDKAVREAGKADLFCCEEKGTTTGVIELSVPGATENYTAQRTSAGVRIWEENILVTPPTKIEIPGSPFAILDCNQATACNCYTCDTSACEGFFWVWAAHCGIYDQPYEASGCSGLDTYVTGKIRWEVAGKFKQNFNTCNVGDNGGGVLYYTCGSTPGGDPYDAEIFADCIDLDRCEPNTPFPNDWLSADGNRWCCTGSDGCNDDTPPGGDTCY
jgi:hypothetical protein